MHCSIRAVGVFAAAAAMLIGSLSTAQAEAPTSSGSADRPSDTVAAITQAVDEAGQAPTADNPAADLPAHGADTVELTGDTGTLAFEVPARDITETTDTGVLLDGADTDTSVAVETTEAGVRALIHIDSPQAPERFEFPVSGDVAALTLNEDGSVDATNAAGDTIATAAPAWAIDADGKAVPTHYEIDDTTLIQLVEHHHADYTYGITADPSWWWWVQKGAKCLTGVITLGALGYAKVSVGLAKLAVQMKAASSTSKLGKAYKAWRNLGDSRSARFST